MNRKRCEWASGMDAFYTAYHDDEWGVPVHDNRQLFEMLILEGAQAGLSWRTILNKRTGYRRAFDNFEAEKIARYSEKKVAALLTDTGIVRNRLKVNAAVNNARAWLRLSDDFGSPGEYLWGFVNGEPIVNSWRQLREIPVTTAESDAMSRELKRRGFKFAGSTTCYAFMQAVGMVIDHTVDCFRYNSPPTEVSR